MHENVIHVTYNNIMCLATFFKFGVYMYVPIVRIRTLKQIHMYSAYRHNKGIVINQLNTR